jgi:hypothetical protein
MAKTPLQNVKDRFGDKAGLVKAVQGLLSSELAVDRVNTDKGLDCVSNKKLLHLHDVLDGVKKEHGSRDKLIAAIAKGEQRDKDADYKEGLSRLPTPRLYEIYRAAQKRERATKAATK